LARTGYLYAHGDTGTFKRLRAHIQQVKPIVMLHNSGGVVTAFSWLQRVLAFSRPAPPPDKLREPLKFLIANLSQESWVNDFGMPEAIMMKGLADRAPQLFRKNVVSVDILTDSDEQTHEVITSCFDAAGGRTAVGLNSAEINVVFSAWKLHLTLCENANAFQSKSVLAHAGIQSLALITTILAIAISSLGTGYDPDGAVLQRLLKLDPKTTEDISALLGYAVLFLPIVSALVTTVASRQQWRDKVHAFIP
jgi:hypothetical protein